MFLAIEGVDGVGKTTTAKAMAKRLECVFVEKPFRLLRTVHARRRHTIAYPVMLISVPIMYVLGSTEQGCSV